MKNIQKLQILNYVINVMKWPKVGKTFIRKKVKESRLIMDNQTVQETAKETLARVREESVNLGISVYSDFIYLAHNDYVIHNDYKQEIDFSNYGYLEFCLFADALKLFENNGYDQLTQIIDELEDSE